MKGIEDKGTLSGNSHSSSSASNSKIRIVVFGQNEVGKSALTVRYLTRRYIGEYKSNTDMLYRQTVSVSHGSSMDVEIVDISTSDSEETCNNTSTGDRKTFPVEEMAKADGFIIVYSITDRSSFTFALETLAELSNYYQSQRSKSFPSPNSSPAPSPPSSKAPIIHPIVLVANKNDLEHLRVVEKVEGVSASIQFSTHFFEISVAENSPEVYQTFQTIISTYITSQPVKRKFSVSKMLGNLRLGRTSPQQVAPVAISQASIIDTSYDHTASSKTNDSSSSTSTSGSSSSNIPQNLNSYQSSKNQNSKQNSSNSDKDRESSGSNISSSICQLKSKLVDFHTMKKRHHSPPICSL